VAVAPHLVSFIHAGCRRILRQHLATSGARARWFNGDSKVAQWRPSGFGYMALWLPVFGTHLLKRHANHEQKAKRQQQQQQRQEQRVDKSKCSCET